jgi:hypothetical protein
VDFFTLDHFRVSGIYSYQYRTIRYSYKIIQNNTYLNIDLNFCTYLPLP